MCDIKTYIKPANISESDIFDGQQHTNRMKDTIDHYIENREQYVFQGEATIRDIPTNVWAFKSQKVQSVVSKGIAVKSFHSV